MKRLFLILTATFGLSASDLLVAHSVWMEPAQGQLVIRFAEPGDDFETSPGHLDSLSAPLAFVPGTNAPAPMETLKKSDHFLVVGASSNDAVCAESTYTVRGGRKPHFYARWHRASHVPTGPALTLDLVPSGKPGEVRAYFRGAALPGIKATLRTPDGQEQELTADAEGILRFQSSAPGQHLLTIAHHREPLAGFHVGRAYQQASHNVALTWHQP